ncbi:pilus assembly PilX family protein [Halioxenophilus aromaticivorans]|uniref:Type 4 fimbrial biogenesis protein PilX N-terminal domain-containing protein n=1 Tax=Halioxenophilus aromaticivorans TaxID=1306992 RepID=A0AAV3TYK9_9ALTE
MKRRTLNTASPSSQSGAVLAVSLVILLVLTVVVMSANSNVIMQERMTSAIRETNLVFQVAESALVEAENFIDTLDAAGFANFNSMGTGGLYSEGDGPGDYLADSTWDTAGNKLRAAESIVDNYQAWYFIESMGQVSMIGGMQDVSMQNDYSFPHDSPMADVFRVVVRAVGPNGVTEQIIAGYYSVNAL